MADNAKYLQAQGYTLAGSGCIMGATTITLNAMLQIDGITLVTMSDFGNEGFATIEPGNGTREEQIVFTGITQNANGTATLTGVSNVLFAYPYTQTSGTSLSHPGGVRLVISNTSGFYDRFANKADDETIVGTWTFPTNDPTRAGIGSDVDTAVDTAFVTLGQLSRQAIAGAANASTTVKGLVQLPTQAQVDARTTTGSTGALLSLTPDKQRSTLLSDYVADTGAANAYVITPVPAISAYTVGQGFSFKAANANTTTSTLNVSGLGAKTINKAGVTALAANDILAGQIVLVEYDGTNFQMLQPVGNAPVPLPATSSSNINEFLTTTDGAAISWGRPFDYQSFTGNGTWTKPTNLSGNEMVVIEAWGGGGSGGSNGGSSGAGGGGGACVIAQFRASDLSSTETVTVGAAATAGNAGNNTTFGSHITAYGGGKGWSDASSTVGAGGGGGGALSAGSNGAQDAGSNAAGAAGGSPAGGVGSTVAGVAGTDSSFGGAAGGGRNSSAPTSASGGMSMYGGGGGGASSAASGSAAGGSSFYGGGGGGGGGANAGSGGTSLLGGAGGAGGNSANGSAGVAPGGGGGGAGGTHTGGSGARGEVRVWTFY